MAANLAASLSEMGNGAVLLVDANAGDPSVHRIFQTKLSPGLLDVLATVRTATETTRSFTGRRV